MFNHSLIFLALISSSIVSNAAAIPMDADQAVMDATQNAVLYREVAIIQGGDSDKDVTEAPADETSPAKSNPPAVSDWFTTQDDADRLPPVAVLLLIIGLIVFFLSRKSSSTK